MIIRLHDEWHFIIRKAWSFRLAIVAGLLSAITVIMGVLVSCGSSVLFMAAFTVVSILASVAGFAAAAARITAQPKTMP